MLIRKLEKVMIVIIISFTVRICLIFIKAFFCKREQDWVFKNDNNIFNFFSVFIIKQSIEYRNYRFMKI